MPHLVWAEKQLPWPSGQEQCTLQRMARAYGAVWSVPKRINVFFERNPACVTSQASRICWLVEMVRLRQRQAYHQVVQWWNFNDGFKGTTPGVAYYLLLSTSFTWWLKLDIFVKIVSVSVLPMLANTGAPELWDFRISETKQQACWAPSLPCWQAQSFACSRGIWSVFKEGFRKECTN